MAPFAFIQFKKSESDTAENLSIETFGDIW